ncbi:MAG: Muramoyltetrapeptide carboxypeptidase [Gammaproteobacteria bacterium]|jgi:muramoyltetrapeptide carboxypeptidase|nr:Muramoyltetrapeptide carboxypeptidase [Gammaproteobacteria bacterium]
MHALPSLKRGDSVNIIAPASRCTDKQLQELINLLESWQLNCIVAEDIFGPDVFCANTDEIRLKQLVDALQNPITKAIICARGGYGSMRLIPELTKITPSKTAKLFVGMSDTTALQLYLQQRWQWPTIHGASAPDRFSPASLASLKSILFAESEKINFTALSPLNHSAKENRIIQGCLIGGNLSLVQASIGTSWQLSGKDKIILLEDTGERGYRIDRMLQHLKQAHIFKEAAAILLGDFIGGKEPDGTSLIQYTLQCFADSCTIPVVQIKGIGHDYTNFSLPLGTDSWLTLGDNITLTCAR